MGLVAGRSQREKRRSYKDLLREEEEIDAQVRKTSKKRRVSHMMEHHCHRFIFLNKLACLAYRFLNIFAFVCLQDSDPFATGGELQKKKKRLHEEEHFHKGKMEAN